MGYFQHLKRNLDLNCDVCDPGRREEKVARGFPYPDRQGDIKEDCAKGLLFGCPLLGGCLPYPRLPAAIDAFNFLSHSVPWAGGGFSSQPSWYRQLMSAMDAASSEESRIELEENRKEAEDATRKRPPQGWHG